MGVVPLRVHPHSSAGRGPGYLEGRGRGSSRTRVCGGGGQVAGKRRPLSFRFASPGQASSKNRTATQALTERSRPNLRAVRLTQGPRNGVANSRGPAGSGRRPEPRSRGPAALAQPEKLAVAAPVGPASP